MRGLQVFLTNLKVVGLVEAVPTNIPPYYPLAEDALIAEQQDTCWPYVHGQGQKAVERVKRGKVKDQKEKLKRIHICKECRGQKGLKRE